MVTYPIQIKRDSYRGNNAARQSKAHRHNDVAARIERHVNAQILQQESVYHSYMYSIIANELGLDRQLVSDCCMAIDGGHNGFTVIRPDLTPDQAAEAMRTGNIPSVGRPITGP